MKNDRTFDSLQDLLNRNRDHCLWCDKIGYGESTVVAIPESQRTESQVGPVVIAFCGMQCLFEFMVAAAEPIDGKCSRCGSEISTSR